MDAEQESDTVQRQRLEPDQIDSAIGEVRALLRARGRDRTEWEVGSSAWPPGLVDLLLARGLVRDRDSIALRSRCRSRHRVRAGRGDRAAG